MKMKWAEEWNSAQPVERSAFILVAVASLLNVLLGILNYPVIGHDAYVHSKNWLDQFTRFSSLGICYPRWLPDSFGGFGAHPPFITMPLLYIGWQTASIVWEFHRLQLFINSFS